MNNYMPHPIDFSDIELPEELLSLREDIARNVHEAWAAQRYADGWSYGPERNDRLRQHPCLVPYDELSEEEREYDRTTALNTLRMIYYLGFKIEKQ